MDNNVSELNIDNHHNTYNLRSTAYSNKYDAVLHKLTNLKPKLIKNIKKKSKQKKDSEQLGLRRSNRTILLLKSKLLKINKLIYKTNISRKSNISNKKNITKEDNNKANNKANNKSNNKANKKPRNNIYKNNSKSIYKKGRQCSINGNRYEKKIHSILRNTYLYGIKFNTQSNKDLAGSNSHNDLVCNFMNTQNIGIEAKICNTPDWMQCSLKNISKNNWEGSVNGKIPLQSRLIFNKILKGKKIFNNKIPPFIHKKLTYNEWRNIKNNSDYWNDQYFTISKDTIKNLYREKGCYYIQISEYGLYHLGNDICNFKVPEFIIDQQLRVRVKIHKTRNKNGYCQLSITAACQPKDITILKKSHFSLDNKYKLPPNLQYIEQ